MNGGEIPAAPGGVSEGAEATAAPGQGGGSAAAGIVIPALGRGIPVELLAMLPSGPFQTFQVGLSILSHAREVIQGAAITGGGIPQNILAALPDHPCHQMDVGMSVIKYACALIKHHYGSGQGGEREAEIGGGGIPEEPRVIPEDLLAVLPSAPSEQIQLGIAVLHLAYEQMRAEYSCNPPPPLHRPGFRRI